MGKEKNIAILCSGGDSPGMNCAVRAATRAALYKGFNVYAIIQGYKGLLEENFKALDAASVGNIMQRGGTILQTSRCPEFMEEKNRKKAADILKNHSIDSLIVIGGNGSFNGAWALHKEQNIPVVGVPATIDNDISSTDYTIGFDTAVHTAVEAVDKIRDTAHSHARNFIIEVMGRRSPAISIHVGICTGAENVVLPNKEIDYKKIVSDINRGQKRGKDSSIIICAEGAKEGLSYTIQKKLKEEFNLKTQVCILGHIQRGGNPSVIDRFLASRMGFVAIEAISNNEKAVVTSYTQGLVQLVPLEKCLEEKVEYLPHNIEMLTILSI